MDCYNPYFKGITVVFLVFLMSCNKEDGEVHKGPFPLVETVEINQVTAKSAMVTGIVVADSGLTILTRGICWGKTPLPNIEEDSVVENDSDLDTFNLQIKGLQPMKTYYVRAFATNKNGTGYGGSLSFSTKEGVIDSDGNVYNIVKIGTQIWMAEDLRTTKYNEGTEIKYIASNSVWENTKAPAFSWYNNDPSKYKEPYGAYYNWYVVNTGALCPTGWHVPSLDEWKTLSNYLGGYEVSGGKLKEEGTLYWDSPNSGATNETGFSGIAGGSRDYTGTFFGMGIFAFYWSTNESKDYFDNEIAWGFQLHYADAYSGSAGMSKNFGHNVRCIKDK